MKRRFIYSVILLGLMSLILLGYQIPLEKVKTWQESSFADFADGEFQNTVLEDKNGGLIRLPHPMQRVQQDSLISSCPRFVAYDSMDDFYATWVEQPTKNVFLQKYDPMGEKIGEQVQVNDTTSSKHSYHSAVAVMPKAGRLLVAWGDDRNYPGNSTQTFAQLFDLNLAKIGPNINISQDKIERSNSDPAAIANSTDGTFWIFLRISGDPGIPKLFIQRCSVSGELVGVPFAVNPDHIFYNEWSPAAIPTPDGGCVVVWSGIPEQGMDYPNIYGIRLSVSCNPMIPPQRINDDSVPNGHYSPDIARDTLGNFLIVWSEWRESAGNFPIYENIYGQYVDSLIQPIRENFLVSLATKESKSDSYPDVERKDDCFVITWLSWNEQKWENDLFENSWQYQPVFYGTYTSSIFDMGPSLGDPEFMHWQSLTHWDTCSIKFQLRAAHDFDSLLLSCWFGPTDSISYYANASGDSINPILKNQRYIQYRALLETRSTNVSPVLNQISITYVAYDTIAPAIPQNLQAIAGHSQVNLSWDANSASDLMAYRIYRGLMSGQYSSSELATVIKPATSFIDTSAVTGTTYFYVIAAVDSNLNESLFSNEVSACPFGVTIYVNDDVAVGGNGSKEYPFKTVHDGIATAVYGDTVLVLPGIYTENIVMKAGVALLGSGAKVTTIRANTSETALAIVIGANDAILQGFTIIHPGTSDQRYAFLCDKSSPEIFDNIFINYGSANSTGPAIFCFQSSPLISRNLISSFSTSLYCYDSCNVTFKNNIVLNKKSDFQVGIQIDQWSNAIVTNNTIVLNGSMGCAINSALSDPIISNNILFNPHQNFDGLINVHGVGQPQISYNNIWVGRDAYNGCNPGIGDIQAEPMFISFDRGDFRLADGSPCINAGDPDSIYNDVNGTRNDMGAFGGPDPINLSLTLKLFASIRTSSVSGFPGDTVKVSVELENAAGIALANCVVDFDSALLEAVAVKKTVLTNDFSLKTDLNNPGNVKIELSHNKEIPSGEGSIVDIFFKVNENARSEQATSLVLQSTALRDGSGSAIEIKQVTHGCFFVNFMSGSEHIIYVNGNYSGIEDGSPGHPYKTINKGIFHSSDGDTIFVASGIYHEMVKIEKGIFLKGSGAQATILEGDSLSELEYHVIHLNTDKPCGISDFTIRNKPGTFVESLIVLDAAKAIIKRNRLITDDLIPGFSLVDWSGSDGGIFLGNYVQGSMKCLAIEKSANLIVKNNSFIPVDFGTSAIYCDASGVTIHCNRMRTAGSSSGISVINSTMVSIKNNIIESQDYSGGGIEINESNTDIINNTIVTSNFGIGIELSTNFLTRIMNNIVVGFNRGSTGISSTQNTILSYNNVWNHTNNYVGLTPDISNISANPMFVEPRNSNFHLQPGSPCIDAGNPDPIYNDLDGSRNDMGAFGGPLADTTGFLGRQVAVALVEPQYQSGDTLYIPVNATNVQGISNIEMKIEYNESQLRLLAIRHGGITQPFSLTESQETPGITQLRLSSPLVIRENSGSICELMAQVQTTADTSTVIRLNDLIFKDQVENVYNAAPVEGQIIITAINSKNKRQNLVPDQFALLQNYPNPFNPSTIIRYNLPKSSFISLRIYNLLGQEIRTLYDGVKSAGNHQLIWDGKDHHGIELPSGLYFCRLSVESGQWQKTIKLLLVR